MQSLFTIACPLAVRAAREKSFSGWNCYKIALACVIAETDLPEANQL